METNLPTETQTPRIVALNRDVFFGVKLSNLAKALGYDLALVPNVAAVDAALIDAAEAVALVIIDMNVLDKSIDWSALAAIIGANPAIPTLGFGSHTDVDSRRAAKATGLTRIVSNGDFHRNAPDLVQRYARAIETT